jgi:hypothetical protein
VWLLLLAAATGCATHADRIRNGRELYFRGQAEQAALALEKALPQTGKDRDVTELDLAMAQLFAGRPAQAEQTLREVRDRFDYLEQKDLTEAALSYLTDTTSGPTRAKIMRRSCSAWCWRWRT